MYIVWLGAHDNCHIHYTPHSAIVIAGNVFKCSYTRFVNSGDERWEMCTEGGTAMCILTTISDRSSGNRPRRHFTHFVYALKKGPKNFICTFCPNDESVVEVSFRDERVYSVNITWWVARWNLIIVYGFCSANVFDDLQMGQRNAVSRLGTKGNGQYNCGVGRGYGWRPIVDVFRGRRNGKRTVELLNNSRNESKNWKKKTRKTVPVRHFRWNWRQETALHVNIGPQCANTYHTFLSTVHTCHYILYYYISHYHVICVFIILAKHNFGWKTETINLSFLPRKYIFISAICRFSQDIFTLIILRVL